MKHRTKPEQQHIRVELEVKRQKEPGAAPYLQRILYETDDPEESVASALTRINREGDWKDLQGEAVGRIYWESSCLQKRCGACAMVIDGRPQLACGSLLRHHRGTKPMTVEPLSRFPVVRDLVTDRHILFDNLKTFGMWEDGAAVLNEKRAQTAYEASRCLQCGCCLEVCPNFAPGGTFFGAAGFVPAARLLSSLPKEQRERIRKSYLEHEYKGCGKSLACMDICPAGIRIEDLLIRSNAAALFRRG